MNHNIAIRNIDTLRLFRDWLSMATKDPGSKIHALSGAILLACANFEGIDPRSISFGPANQPEGLPGRPKGVKGFKSGTGRRSRTDAWTQHNVLECVWKHLTLCQDLIQEANKGGKRPSKAMVLRIISARALRHPTDWLGTPPKWAVRNHLMANTVELPESVSEVEFSPEFLEEVEAWYAINHK